MRLLDAPGGGYLPAGFLELPLKVYRGDPNWIPEDPAKVVAQFGAANPWFEHGRAHAFCVPSKARAAAFRPDGLTIDGAPAAFFGYWESVGDEQANAVVMEAVRAWALQEGATAVDRAGQLLHGGRLSRCCSRTESHSRRSSASRTTRRPIPDQLEALGFELYTRYLTHVFERAVLA